MIERLTIEGYRGFERFEMEGLGRINLLVGRNQAGKTSVLEAVRLLQTVQRERAEFAGVLWSTARRRGGVIADHVRVTDLFHQPAERERCDIVRIRDQDSAIELTVMDDESHLLLRHEQSSRGDGTVTYPLAGGDSLGRPSDVGFHESRGWAIAPVAGPELSDVASLTRLFGRVVLRPEEGRLVDELRLIDPRIERLGASGDDEPRLMVKLRGFPHPVPLGDLGGGVSRLTQLWLWFAMAGDGPFLVDEIDTGLHHSLMIEMWRQISRLTTEKGIQVFATTHSWDCVSALGEVCILDGLTEADVTMHRIEPRKGKSVRYSPERIAVAAENGIEVR